MRNHPVGAAFVVGAGVAALFMTLRVTDPAWLLHALQFLLDLFPLGVALLVVGWFLARRGVDWFRPITALAGFWVGFVAGWFVIGAMTCAFCLS